MKRVGEALCDQDHRDLRDAVKRIEELEAALYKAHGILGGLSMGTDGRLRRRICTVYNIVGKPLGKGRSSHGDEADE